MPAASSTRSTGRRHTSSVTRGAGTSPSTLRRPCRTGSWACSPSTRSARSATDAGRSSTRRYSAARLRTCASGRVRSTSSAWPARPATSWRSRGCASSGPRTSPIRSTHRRCPNCASRACGRARWCASILAELPALEAGLPGIRVPVGFVHGSRSPMPIAASTDAAERIPGAWVEVVEGAGHFVWVEAPGAVRAALRRLTRLALDRSSTAVALPSCTLCFYAW